MRKSQTKRSSSSTKKPVRKAKQYVYAFGAKTDGNAKMRELLGGKGANLAEMA